MTSFLVLCFDVLYGLCFQESRKWSACAYQFNFLFWFFLKIIFINRHSGKLILYPAKNARLDGALGLLKGIRLLDALCIHMDVSTLRCTYMRW
jgi:hypothetical protein